MKDKEANMKNKNKLTGLLKEIDYVRDQVQILGDQLEDMDTMKEELSKLTRDFWEYTEDTNKKNCCGKEGCKKK